MLHALDVVAVGDDQVEEVVAIEFDYLYQIVSMRMPFANLQVAAQTISQRRSR